MKKMFAVLVVGLVTVTASSVFAQKATDYTAYNFDDDLVQGDLVRPNGESLFVRKKGAHESLVRIRENFIPELLNSVEDLQSWWDKNYPFGQRCAYAQARLRDPDRVGELD